MTEEEKKAIAYLRFYSNDDKDEYFDKTFKIDKFFCKKILNLIEKLQKEIKTQEDGREQLYLLYIRAKRLAIDKYNVPTEELENLEIEVDLESNYIHKDKIRELFKELYIIEESKYAKNKTTDNDKLYKFANDIEKLLEEEE